MGKKVATAVAAALGALAWGSASAAGLAGLGDPKLDAIAAIALASSPAVEGARAETMMARAQASESGAALLPSAGLSGGAGRQSTAGGGAPNWRSAQANVGLDLDLFGKNKAWARQARERAGGKEQDERSATLATQAGVADSYLAYRACRLKLSAYAEALESYGKTVAATRVAVETGFKPSSDLALAIAGEASARSSKSQQAAECEDREREIAYWTGLPIEAAREAVGPDAPLPTPPEETRREIPAAALSSRPDLAAAERRLAAAMEGVGAAKADKMPSLSLSGVIGLAGSAALTPWSFAAALAAPLFDGGARDARVQQARAGYASALADYKELARKAVKEAQQALGGLDAETRREADAALAAEQYKAYFAAASINWEAGRAGLLDLEQARRQALGARIALVDARWSRASRWVGLYRALGGALGEPAAGARLAAAVEEEGK